MVLKRYFGILILVIELFLASFGSAFAIEDGFVAVQEIKADHFTIYCAPGVTIISLIKQLGIGATDTLLAGKEIVLKEQGEQEFAQEIDTFFVRVCDILDMHLYSFHGNIKICLDQAELEKIYLLLYGRSLDPVIHAFYSHGLNTIYVSEAGVTRSILGHEVAHQVMSNYFVVLPSVRIQEVLAGYVEYQLRKNPNPA